MKSNKFEIPTGAVVVFIVLMFFMLGIGISAIQGASHNPSPLQRHMIKMGKVQDELFWHGG
jgi:hypothetical protein